MHQSLYHCVIVLTVQPNHIVRLSVCQVAVKLQRKEGVRKSIYSMVPPCWDNSFKIAMWIEITKEWKEEALNQRKLFLSFQWSGVYFLKTRQIVYKANLVKSFFFFFRIFNILNKEKSALLCQVVESSEFSCFPLQMVFVPWAVKF